MLSRLSFVIACLFFAAAPSQAATPTCVSTNCEALGYTKTASACGGAEFVKCPFDSSKVACRPAISTPVFNLVKDLLVTHANISETDNIQLDMSLNNLCSGGWSAKCAQPYCTELEGDLKMQCSLSEFKGFSTVNDIVTWVENNLLTTQACYNAVAFDSTLYSCASTCPTDPTKCLVTPELITCEQAIEKIGGVKLSRPDINFEEGKNYYLTDDVLFGTITIPDGVGFWSAKGFKPCENDPNVKERPVLRFENAVIDGSSLSDIRFNLPTQIKYLETTEGHGEINIYAGDEMEIEQVTSFTGDGPIKFQVQDKAVQFGFACSRSSYAPFGSCHYIIDEVGTNVATNITYCILNNITATGASYADQIDMTCNVSPGHQCEDASNAFGCALSDEI